MKSEIKYRKLIENTNDIIYSVDSEGMFTFVSSSWTRILGHDIAEVVGHSFAEFVHPDDWDRCKKILELVVRTGERHGSVEYRVRHKNGDWRWHSSNTSPVMNSEGVVIGGDGVARDITKEKNQEIKLQKSNVKLKEAKSQLQEKNRFQEILVDITSSFINIPLSQNNDAIKEALCKVGTYSNSDRVYIFDYNFEEQTTSNTHEWCAPGIASQIDELQDLPLEVVPQWVEKHKKGEQMLIADVSKLPDDSGVKQILEPQKIKSLLAIPLMNGEECLGFVGFDAVADIHQFSDEELNLLNVFASALVNLHIRNQAEIELKQTNQNLKRAKEEAEKSETKFRQAFDYAGIGMVLVSLEGKLLKLNQSACEIWGYSETELLNMTFQEFTHKEDLEKDLSLLKQTIEGKIDNYRIKKRYIKKSGDLIWTNLNVSIIRGKDDTPEYFISQIEDITKQVSYEQELIKAKEKAEQNETRFLQVSEVAEELIWEVDSSGLYTYVSPVIESLLGYRPDEVVGKKYFYDLFIPEKREEFKQAASDQILKQESFKNFENILAHKNGDPLYVTTSARPIYDGDGIFMGYRGVDTDITEHKQAEEAARKSAERAEKQRNLIAELSMSDSVVNGNLEQALELTTTKLATILEVDRVSVWLLSEEDSVLQRQILFDKVAGIDMKINVLNVSKYPSYFKAMHQKSMVIAEDARNNSSTKELADDYFIPLQISSLLDTAIQQNGQLKGVLSAEHRGSIRHWHSDEVSFLSSISNLIAQLYANAERKKAENRLRESESRFRKIYDNPENGMVLAGTDLKFFMANQAFCQMTGYKEEELKELTFNDITHPADIAKDMAEAKKMMAGEVDAYRLEKRYIKKNGQTIWVHLSVSPIYDSNNQLQYFIGIVSDNTERKQAEQALQQSEEKIRFILKHDPNAIAVFDNNMNTLLVSDRFLEDYDVNEKEIIGKNHYEVFPNIPEKWRKIHQRALQGEVLSSTDDYFIRPDGSKTYTRWECRPWYHANGQIGGMIAYTEVITERKLAENALKESEAKFKSYIENAPEGIFIANEKGEYVEVNKAACSITGYSKDELLNLTIPDLIQEEYREKAKNELETLHKVGFSNAEMGFITKSGEKRFWIVDAIKLSETRFLTFAKDITERKEAEEALKLQSKILENIAEGVYLIRKNDGVIVYTNSTFDCMFGYDPGELIGKHVSVINAPSDKSPEETAEEITQSLLENETWSGEVYNLKKNGTAFWCRANVSTFNHHEYGTVWIAVHHDINMRKRVNEELKENEIRLNVAIDGTGAGIWDWDMINNTVTFSKQWKRMLGYDEDEIDDSFDSWKKLWHPDDVEHIEKAINDHIAGKTEKYEIVNRLKHCDGSWRWIMTRGKLLRDDNSKPYRWVGTNIDITSQKEAELKLAETNEILEDATALANTMAAEAEMANAAKSEFLANMSHEIRTPMNSVVGFSELLQDTELNSVQQEYVNTVISSSKGLLGIINDILDFSKIEAGKLDIEIVETDVIELIEEAADLVKHPAGQKGIELLLNIDPDIHRFAMIDPVRLRQVLANLLSNALKFTEEGEIELKASLLKMDEGLGTIQLSVRDTGIGISALQKEKLFKAFMQADNSTTRKYGGTGLGLVISQQLVQLMGGTLEFKSEQGVGSEFYFTIEIELRKGEKAGKTTISDIKRCLVIDDNENNRTILERTLTNWGVDCVTCSNGYDSLQILEETKEMDVLLCDYQMPYVNGLETVEMIRQKLNLPPEKLPVILLHSSVNDGELNDKCNQLGINFRLTKPIKQRELLNCLLNAHHGKNEEPEVIQKGKKVVKNEEQIDTPQTLKILIAEDNSANLKLVSILIRRLAADVELFVAQNGKEALDKMINLKPDIVFMDVQMPEMDGNEATAKLRKYEKKEKLSRTVVVGLTAGALKQEKDKSLESGMDDFLTKPIEKNKLKAVLIKYLKNKNDENRDVDVDVDTDGNHISAANNNERFDRKSLLGMLDGDVETMTVLVSDFIEVAHKSINELEGLLQNNSLEEAAKVAHSMKGTAANMRCGIFTDLIKSTEKEILSDNVKAADKVLKALKEEWEILSPVLKDSI